MASDSADTTPRPVVVDTDLSFDDYVALLYLLQHPGVDVQAITVVNGVAHVGPGLENLRRLLAFVNRSSIPLAAGPEQPLTGQRQFPRLWRFLLDYGPRLLLPKQKAPAPAVSAPELIREQILASDRPLTFIMLGPLTNLALVLHEDPALAARIDTVVISGGAVQVPGVIHADRPDHPNAVSEWNLYLDPGAAETVFNAGVSVALVPLDVTHVQGAQPLLFNRAFIRQLSQVAQGKAANLLVRLLRLWQPVARMRYGTTPVWDGAVAALAANPALCQAWHTLGLRILTEPDAVAGQTIVDDSQSTQVRVCLAGEQPTFEAAYLAVIGTHHE